MQENIADALRAWAWIIAALVVLVIGIVCAELVSVKVTSITMQLFGSVVALLGFLVAYLAVTRSDQRLERPRRSSARRRRHS